MPNATVAADTTACAGLSSKDNCAILQDAAESSSTTVLLAGTEAMYAANGNVIGKDLPTTTPARNVDPIRLVRCNFSAVGCSDSEVLDNSTFIMQAGTTASQTGTTAVFADFPTDNSAAAAGKQFAMIPANRGCNNQPIQGGQSNEIITIGDIPCGSTPAATQCQPARTTAQDGVIGSALHYFCNILPTIVSESSGESDNDSVPDSSDSEYECESKIEDSHAYYLLHDFSAPAIDLLISREGATVDELAIPSAEEFAD